MYRLFGVWIVCLWLSGCVAPTPVDQRSIESDGHSLKGLAPLRGEVSVELLTAGCFACHGPQGYSGAPAVPSLAGLPKDYFIEVMRAYQYGGRYGSVMPRIARGFDLDEIGRMADFFSRLDAQPHRQRVDWEQVNQGRQLHRLYCRKCHGDLTQAPLEAADRLNGQWMDYLRWTLQDYLIGINQADAQMSESLTRLVRRHGDEGLEALINYLGSARP